MLEVALRANGATAATGPTVMVMDSRPRLEVADAMLKALIDCKFLIDQEEEYNQPDSKLGNDELRLTEYKLTSTDYATDRCTDLTRLITPAGLAWLRASPGQLKEVEAMIDEHDKHKGMCRKVKAIFKKYKFDKDLQPDGRPIIGRIWKIFYGAQLFASGTHYITFDTVEVKGKPVSATLGEIGNIFLSGSTDEHRKLVECIQENSPILLSCALPTVAASSRRLSSPR